MTWSREEGDDPRTGHVTFCCGSDVENLNSDGFKIWNVFLSHSYSSVLKFGNSLYFYTILIQTIFVLSFYLVSEF